MRVCAGKTKKVVLAMLMAKVPGDEEPLFFAGHNHNGPVHANLYQSNTDKDIVLYSHRQGVARTAVRKILTETPGLCRYEHRSVHAHRNAVLREYSTPIQ
jgi:hypothetical protein